jgi:hypothetical protein
MKDSISRQKRCFVALSIMSFSLTITLSACGLQTFADPYTNPIVQDDVRLNDVPYEITSLTPTRRVIVFANGHFGSPASSNPPEGQIQNTHYCAESPTDAGENISSAAAASVAAKLPSGNDVGVAAAKELATALQVLNKKTQGVIYFEKISYRLCEAEMNRRIMPEAYASLLAQAHKDSVDLIKEELNKGFTQTDFNSQSIVISDAAELVRVLNELSTGQNDEQAPTGKTQEEPSEAAPQ